MTICLRPRVGQHVVAGTTLGWVWAPSAEDPTPAAGVFEDAVHADIRIGFERTLEQDVGFGIRQQIDIASKALSAAINDPYTAVQAIDHLTVVCCDLAVRPLGSEILRDPAGRGRVVVPGNTFADYLFFVTGLVGRYGGNEYSVMSALVRLIRSCVEVLPAGSERLVSLDQAAVEVLGDVERMMQRPADVASVRAAVELGTEQDHQQGCAGRLDQLTATPRSGPISGGPVWRDGTDDARSLGRRLVASRSELNKTGAGRTMKRQREMIDVRPTSRANRARRSPRRAAVEVDGRHRRSDRNRSAGARHPPVYARAPRPRSAFLRPSPRNR